MQREAKKIRPRFKKYAYAQVEHINSVQNEKLKIEDVRFVTVPKIGTAIQLKVRIPKISKKFREQAVWICAPLGQKVPSLTDPKFIRIMFGAVSDVSLYPADASKPNASIFADKRTQRLIEERLNELTQPAAYKEQMEKAHALGYKENNVKFGPNDDIWDEIHGIDRDLSLARKFIDNNIRLSIDKDVAELVLANHNTGMALLRATVSMGVNILKYSLAVFTLPLHLVGARNILELAGIPTSFRSKNIRPYWAKHYKNHYIYAPRVKLTAG